MWIYYNGKRINLDLVESINFDAGEERKPRISFNFNHGPIYRWIFDDEDERDRVLKNIDVETQISFL